MVSRRIVHELAEDEDGDQEAHDRVGVLPPGDDDDERGDDDADRAEEVGDHVSHRRFDVQARVTAAVKDSDRRRVDEEADDRDDEHPPAQDLTRVVEPPDRLHEDPDRDRDERDAVCERGENLGAVQAEGALRSRRALRQPDGEEREAERHRIREHVPRVRKQGKASGENATDDLGDQEGRRQDEYKSQSAPGLRARMVVPMSVSHGRSLSRAGAALLHQQHEPDERGPKKSQEKPERHGPRVEAEEEASQEARDEHARDPEREDEEPGAREKFDHARWIRRWTGRTCALCALHGSVH